MNKNKLFSLAMLAMVLTAVLSVRANATDRFTPPFPIFQSIANGIMGTGSPDLRDYFFQQLFGEYYNIDYICNDFRQN